MSVPLEFGILGPVAARRGGSDVRLGGIKQRALLAVLLLHAGEIVSSDRLIDALWGESPPADAQTALQAHVSRLRKLLDAPSDDEPQLLVTRVPGYVLLIGDEQLDVRRFARLVAEGRARLAAGDAAGAAAQMREALGLWRGRPLADLENEPFAAAVTRELDEARMEAVEMRIEADLACGRHAELVAELVALVRGHPLRERLRGQLMLALYRCGRQAEALEAFDAGRRTFAEELGLSPSEQLRGLHAAILAQERTLDLVLPSPRPAQPPANRRPRWRRPRVVGAALCAFAALVVVAAVLDGGEAGDPARAGGAIVHLDPSGDTIERSVSVGTTPGAVAIGADAVWVVDIDGQTVSRVASGSSVATTFATGATPTDLATGAGALWVANGTPLSGTQSSGPVATSLARVDPATRTVRARIALPRRAGATTELTEDHLAVQRDAVWMIGPDYAVVRIDPRTNRVIATIRGLQARAIAAGDAGVWVLGLDGTIVQIDRTTNRIRSRDRVRASAVASLTVGGGAAWISAPGDGTIWRAQPGPRLVMRTIDVGPGVGDLAFGAGALWAVNPLRGTVSRIDPAGNRVTRVVRLGGAPRAVAASGDGVWVAVVGDARQEPGVARAGGDAGGPIHGSCEPTLYRGDGSPQRLIVTDLPLQGGVRLSAQQMAHAAAFVLRARGFRAGDLRIGIQSCDDSIARTGLFDPAKCAANARAYARDPRVIGVVGTLNSPCSLAALPELARAAADPPPMVSPVNSYVGLTRPAAGAPPGELAGLYPRRRHFARVFPTDDHQAVALAARAGDLGVRRVAVLDDGDLLFGRALADRFAIAARSVGAEVVVRRSWRPEADGYERLAGTVRRARPDAVFLGGILDSNGAAVLRALRRALGPGPKILLSDGFTPSELLLRQAGSAAEGAYLAVSGLINESLPAPGRRFLTTFGVRLPGVDIEPSAVYTAEATGVLLDAIGRSDGSRAGVLDALFETNLERGLTGRVRFDRRGDIVAPPITILRIRRGARGVANFRGAVLDRVVRSASGP